MSSFYSKDELSTLGFKILGYNVKISKKASLYGVENMEIGNNIRIDDFCFLSGKIKIADHIHISAYSSVIAGDVGVEFEEFSGLSSRVSVFACSDDYSGAYLTNPTVPESYTNIIKGKVKICKHAIVGANCVILPGVTIAEGCSIGAMSFVNKSTEAWGVYLGIPAKRIKSREKSLLKLEEEYMKQTIPFKIGDSAEIKNVISEEDIQTFAKVSGDYNPIHLDDKIARNTLFKGRIAHGMLSASYISNVIGNILPGAGTIYLSQSLNFCSPVRIGNEVTTRIIIKDINIEKMHIHLHTLCFVGDRIVVKGDAVVLYQGVSNE